MTFYPRILLALAGALLLINNVSAEPPNLGILKKELRQYHDAGIYQQELSAVAKEAKHYILTQARKNQQLPVRKKLAVVLDIDETCISNYDKFAKYDFMPSKEQIHRDILKADAPAIKPMLDLYNAALKEGVSVFFVTARPNTDLEATKTNLLRDGYRNWTGLYLRPDNYRHASNVPFKARTRAKISKQGYTIIATIGDQYSDLMGGYAKREFKLPNPWYFLP